jgi:hypothetical protein
MVFVCLPFGAKAELIWPLGIDISQSSSFAEFRGLRFHAGIDLRTQRQTGFPVRAIADGFISRIKVQYRGYGYALYIDHPSLKRRVVYGHLQDFSGPVGDYARKKLRKIGQRFGIDDFFGPDRFPVTKGQVVGISGETGAGPPHLHFEVRNLADEPEAPALLGYRPDDRIYPSFHHLYLEPFSFPCEINGSFLPFRTNLKKKTTRMYKTLQNPKISGKVGVKVGVSDTNGVGNVFGIEKILLEVGGKTAFSRLFHSYSYPENDQASFVYDFVKSNQKGTGYVINMYKLPGETLPFAKEHPAWAGLIDFSGQSGHEDCVLQIVDFGNNQVELQGNFESFTAVYSEMMPVDSLNDYSSWKSFSTAFYTVITGDCKSKAKRDFWRGLINCSDAKGNSEALPCILSGNRIEIAVPHSKKWEKGIWLKNKQIFPDCSLVDQNGLEMDSEGVAKVIFPPGSLNFPIYSRLVKSIAAPPRGGSSKKGWLTPYSGVWKLEPEGVVFRESAKIKIRPANYQGNLQRLGIYSVSEDGKYSHVGEKVAADWLMAETRLGGQWVILEDKVGPTVTYLGKGKDYHLGKIWKFKARDLGEGVDFLNSSATLDGEKVEVYSDPDKSEIYVIRKSNKKTVSLVLTVKDYAGNSTRLVKKL